MADLLEILPVPIEAQIAEVERELRFRRRCYPIWVTDNRMKADGADLHIRNMRAVLDTLNAVKDGAK